MTLTQVKEALLSAGVENAYFEATQLTGCLSGKSLTDAVKRRCEGFPLQYLLGEWDFYRQTYEVNEDCLIPRSDTELLVEQAIKRLPPNSRFLDLCTGSGCVAISTLCERGDTVGVAVDLFEKTLAIAKRNGERNGVSDRLTCYLADVLKAPPRDLPRGAFDAILSNPPYICNHIVPTLQKEVQFEPKAALMGGEDGLDFYRAILNQWQVLLAPGGFFLFEIGYDQASALGSLAEKYGFSHTVFRDFGGNDRVVLLKK
ncbi:MAG: peptide chain release factor N(5)-glutamine methyltransferase [Ruminococcaceae bacterium]|nr:peptide chain release factor N(5)-glutamine methyltransferase [Oscillospiraceae bacterium]